MSIISIPECVPADPAHLHPHPNTRRPGTDDLQHRLDAAHHTIACLHAQADAQAHTAYQVAERLRQELATRNAQLADLEQQLATAEVQHAGQLQQLEEAHATREARTLEAATAQDQRLREELSALEQQLHELRSFAQEREAVHARMCELQQRCASLEDAMAEQAHTLEAARLSSEAALRRAHEEALAAVRQEAEVSAAQRLDALVKRIVRDSETLKTEVAMHTQVTAQLHQELQAARSTCASLQREHELFEQREQAYAARTAFLVKQLEERGVRIDTLERSMAALVAQFEAQRQADADAHHVDLRAACQDVDALRRLAQLQAGQLSKARQVARAALRRRTLVERFFHASIQHAASTSTSEAPPEVQPTGDTMALLCSGELDVGDMPWSQREAVLRLLFAHIRGQVVVPALAQVEAATTEAHAAAAADVANTPHTPPDVFTQQQQQQHAAQCEAPTQEKGACVNEEVGAIAQAAGPAVRCGVGTLSELC